MDTTPLEDAGLTRAEAEVYLALMDIGSSRAGPIIEKTGLQTSVVHRALNSLIAKGLITFVLDGRHKVYQSTDPSSLVRFAEEKAQRVRDILPQLKERRKSTAAQEVTVYKGVNGIREAYYTMLGAKGKEYLTFGGGPPTAEVMGFTFWINLHRKRIERRLKSRQVFDLSVRKKGGTQIERLPLTEIRYLPADFAQFQETVIVGDTTSINVFSHTPYAIIIKDAHVAAGYRKHFESLWAQAQSLK